MTVVITSAIFLRGERAKFQGSGITTSAARRSGYQRSIAEGLPIATYRSLMDCAWITAYPSPTFPDSAFGYDH